MMDTFPSTQSVAIVGPGAIGTTVAAALYESGLTPLLYGRTARSGLELHVGNDRITVPVPVITDPRSVAGPADVVFVAVKATQLQAATAWLTVLCGPGTVVCVLQNGVEQVTMISPILPSGTAIVPAVIWFPAQTHADGTVRLRGEAVLTLPDARGTDRVVDILTGTRCLVDVAVDFTSVAWRKLLQNAMGGLMALTGRRSGVFARSDLADLARAYLHECLEIARAEGAQLDDEVVGEILARFQSFPVDLGTSILTDREAARPLEWDIRNGVVSRFGRVHDIPTPVSDVLVALLAATSDGPG